MPKVKVGDINMYYEVHGEGEPLVLIGGGGSTVESQAQRIKVFSPEYRVVAFESRGAGQSDAPDIPYSMEMFADDLAGLLDATGIDSAHVFGESFGGMIAQNFTLRYPEMVISLILASTNCGMAHGVPSTELIKVFTDAMKLSPEERARVQTLFFITQEFAEKNPGIVQRMIDRITKQTASPQAAIRQQQATMTHDTYERLPDIKAPALVIAGEADRAIPVENSRILASRIPNAQLVTFPNAGHMLIEAIVDVNKIMLEFLKRHSDKKA